LATPVRDAGIGAAKATPYGRTFPRAECAHLTRPPAPLAHQSRNSCFLGAIPGKTKWSRFLQWQGAETTTMKFIKASMLVLALGFAFGLGVWTGPYLTDSDRMARTEATTPAVKVDRPATSAEDSASQPAVRIARAVDAPAANPFVPIRTASDASVQKIAGSLLNQGTNVEMAADGFNDATLFVSTAYAARNTGIPFVILKHRMLKLGYTLSEAIELSKPELDAVAEMERARTKARAVVQKLGS
jgi:hypothetical protein